MRKWWNSGALTESSIGLSIFVWENCCQFILQLSRLKMHLSSWLRSTSCFPCMSVQNRSFDWGETTVTLLYWEKIQILYPAICTNFYVHEQKPYISGLGCFFQRVKGLKNLILIRVNALWYSQFKKSVTSFPFLQCVFGKFNVLLLAVNSSLHV